MKITKARAGLILDAPFFGALSLKLQVKEDDQCETAYTDGKVIGYNPAFIKDLSVEQVKGLLAHEVMHVACCHHTRKGPRDHSRWNVAADYAINLILKESGFQLPEGGLLDPQYKGLSAEEIYKKLPVGTGEGESGKAGQWGEVRELTGKNGKATKAELEQAEQEAKISTIQAGKVAEAAGKLPGSLKRMIKELLQPVIDWKAALARFVQASAKNDYTWSLPAPRYMASGLYMPTMQSEAMGQIVIAIDTSGSVSQKDIDQFASEIQSIADTCNPKKITVLYCDTEVNGKDEFFQGEEIHLELKGGGGTRFSPAFQAVDNVPACFVYLTDGYCSDFPQYTPEYPVLWITNGNKRFAPPFGEVINF